MRPPRRRRLTYHVPMMHSGKVKRLSTGKRINSAADDAGGLSVAYKLNSKMNRTVYYSKFAKCTCHLQVQDSSLSAAGKIVDRMAELRTMAQDITKNTGDIENYSKEFIELQSQLNQISKEKFNGISLFGNSSASAVSGGVLNTGTASFGSAQYTTLSRTLTTHDSGSTESGSVSINVVNFQFMLSINSSASGGTGLDLGNINGSNSGGASEVNSNGYIIDIKEVSVSQFTDIISRIADMRAENGAEQNRVMQRIDLLQSNLTNIEAAHGRIMDADIALESTRFARHNILVQASASMTRKQSIIIRCTFSYRIRSDYFVFYTKS